MNKADFIEIDPKCGDPKYKQLIVGIMTGIEKGVWEIGDQIPSINEMSQESGLARSTVEKAYLHLRKQKIIRPITGKGFYVLKTNLQYKKRILLLLDRINSYNTHLLNVFKEVVGTNTKIDLELYDGNYTIFKDVLAEKQNQYDHLVVFPKFKENTICKSDYLEEVLFDSLPRQKLILIDRRIKQFLGKINQVYQDFDDNFYRVLTNELTNLKKYKKLVLILSEDELYPCPKHLKRGLKRFVTKYEMEYEIKHKFCNATMLEPNDLYIIFEEADLIRVVDKAKAKNYKLGKHIGVVSYGNTILKKYLGISVLETNFQKMINAVSEMLSKKTINAVRVEFNYINRHSA